MSAPQQLRWKGPPVPRAKPLPQEKWEEHRVELCDLYQKTRLEDLMATMKVRYNFTPSKRQYISQFEKWGIQKYNTTARNIRPALLSQHGAGSRANQDAEDTKDTRMVMGDIMDEIRLAGDPFQDLIAESRIAKRPNSLQSLQSLQSLRDLGEKPKSKPKAPAVPPKKRQKLDQFMSSREDLPDPYADLGAAFDTPEPCQPSFPSSSTQPDRFGPGPSGTPSPVSPTRDMDPHTPRFREVDYDMASPDDTSDIDMLLSSATTSLNSFRLDDDRGKAKWVPGAGAPRVPCADEFVDFDQLHPVKPAPQRERQFDSSRPIDTFSEAEIQDMKLAADFLHTTGFDGDAFALYALLLKRSKQSPSPSPRMTDLAMIACTRSAYWPSQIEIVRSHLEPKFELRENRATDVQHFLYRMLLADTYARLGDREIADLIIEHVMGCEFANEGLLLRMPYEYRSLDLLTYQYLTHGLSAKDALVRDSIYRGDIPYNYPVFEKSQLAMCFLQQQPGPFELDCGTMQNPCIRSCLLWCVAMLESPAMMTESWDKTAPNEQESTLTEHFALFCCLWECWQGHRSSEDRPSSQETSEVMAWATHAEKLMGISAAQLLGTVCLMIVRASPPRVEGSDSDPGFLRAQAGAASLVMRSDEELGCHFLDEFTCFDTSSRMLPEQKAFRTTAREYAREFIEKSLSIVLPEAQGSYAEPNELNELNDMTYSPRSSSSMQRNLSIVVAALNPTLARSLNSSDWSTIDQSIRTFRLRIKRTGQDVAMTLPSSAFAGNSMSNLISMTSNCSLESLRTAGTNAMERISTMTSSVRERVEQFEGGPLGEMTMQRIV